MSEVDIDATDRLIWDVARAFRKHPDSGVTTGAGGQRPLFPQEAETLTRIALRVIGHHLADVAEPPAEDSMATDADLLKYDGRHEAADEIRALTEGAWDR